MRNRRRDRQTEEQTERYFLTEDLQKGIFNQIVFSVKACEMRNDTQKALNMLHEGMIEKQKEKH